MLAGVGVEGRCGDDGGLSERWGLSKKWDGKVVVAEKGPDIGAIPEFDPSVTP